MPPGYVKTRRDAIFYYYAKLVVCPSAGFKDNYGMITHVYKEFKTGKKEMSDRNKELLKQMKGDKKCVYCGGSSNAFDHVIPRKLGGPNKAENRVFSCRECNSSKGKKDLVAWWLEKHEDNIDTLLEIRIPLGIYLKYSYDWNKTQDELDTLVNKKDPLQGLRPFTNAK